MGTKSKRGSCLAVLSERGRALAEGVGDHAVSRRIVAVRDGLNALLGGPLVVLACATQHNMSTQQITWDTKMDS